MHAASPKIMTNKEYEKQHCTMKQATCISIFTKWTKKCKGKHPIDIVKLRILPVTHLANVYDLYQLHKLNGYARGSTHLKVSAHQQTINKKFNAKQLCQLVKTYNFKIRNINPK